MFSLAEKWREMDKVRRSPDSAQQWDERSQNYAKDTNDNYARDFIEKMALKTKSLVFDMGCGTGSLAVSLAKQGHGVIAADFSKGMLKRLREAAHAQGVLVLEPTIDRQTGTLCIPHIDAQGCFVGDKGPLKASDGSPCQEGFIIPLSMSWSDDWASLGLRDNIVEYALASRSIITHDLADSLSKLSRVASKGVFVTAILGASPRINPAVAEAMGVVLEKHNDAVFVFGVAHELGFEPEVSYIHSPRIRTYASRDEAYHALLKTLDYRDPSIDQVDRETAAQRLRDWLLIHLIPGKVEGTWQLDKPQIVPWAFISWKTS